MRRALVDAAEQSERLEPIHGRCSQVVAGAPLDLGLAELRADSLGPRRQGRRLAGEGVRVDGEVDFPYASSVRSGL
jgi:hypothetical protein